MKTYTVVNTIKHGTTQDDVTDYEPGDPIELDEKQAAPLLKSGDVVEAPVKAEAETPAKAPAKAKK